jgi:hypothetical protein
MVYLDNLTGLPLMLLPSYLHTALSHLNKRKTYVRTLFIDYSSAFNTIVPTKGITKLRTLGLNTSPCNWTCSQHKPH